MLATAPESISGTYSHTSFAMDHHYADVLIVNADDWGRNRETTDRIFTCMQRGVVSSASGMVFMEDSERAASLACEHGVDIGLHLNMTTPLDAPDCPTPVHDQQASLGRYLRRHRLAQAVYNRRLAGIFRAVVDAQVAEFRRLYGRAPARIDGHHHMHLCANVLHDRLLPEGVIARRSFSFQPGDKSALNRWYRRRIDRCLAERHPMTDFFFQLAPLMPPERLERIFALGRGAVMELETHPVNEDEYQFLTAGGLAQAAPGFSIATRYALFTPREDSSHALGEQGNGHR